MPSLEFEIAGTVQEFLVSESAIDPDLDRALRDLVAEIGPFRREIDIELDRLPKGAVSKTLAPNGEIGLVEQLEGDDELQTGQDTLLVALLAQAEAEGLSVLDAVSAAVVHTDGLDSLRVAKDAENAYLLWISDDPSVANEVLFQTTADNADGVDWLDVVLQLIGGLIGLAIGVRLGAKAIRELREAAGDAVKELLAKPGFRAPLKKLAEALGGGRLIKIYEALKELVEFLWENRNLFCTKKMREWLESLMSLWRLFFSAASWVVTFLSGGTSKAAQVVAMAATLGLKLVRPALTPTT